MQANEYLELVGLEVPILPMEKISYGHRITALILGKCSLLTLMRYSKMSEASLEQDQMML